MRVLDACGKTATAGRKRRAGGRQNRIYAADRYHAFYDLQAFLNHTNSWHGPVLPGVDLLAESQDGASSPRQCSPSLADGQLQPSELDPGKDVGGRSHAAASGRHGQCNATPSAETATRRLRDPPAFAAPIQVEWPGLGPQWPSPPAAPCPPLWAPPLAGGGAGRSDPESWWVTPGGAAAVASGGGGGGGGGGIGLGSCADLDIQVGQAGGVGP